MVLLAIYYIVTRQLDNGFRIRNGSRPCTRRALGSSKVHAYLVLRRFWRASNLSSTRGGRFCVKVFCEWTRKAYLRASLSELVADAGEGERAVSAPMVSGSDMFKTAKGHLNNSTNNTGITKNKVSKMKDKENSSRNWRPLRVNKIKH